MNGDGDSAPVGFDQHAGLRMLGRKDAAGQVLSGSLAIANANAVGQLGDFIDVGAGFFGHAELPLAEGGFDILGSIAGHGDFKIMDQGSAIHGDAGNESAAHEVNENRAEANLDDVAAKSPENGPFLFTRAMNGSKQVAQIPRRQNSRQGVEELREGSVAAHRMRKIADIDLA